MYFSPACTGTVQSFSGSFQTTLLAYGASPSGINWEILSVFKHPNFSKPYVFYNYPNYVHQDGDFCNWGHPTSGSSNTVTGDYNVFVTSGGVATIS